LRLRGEVALTLRYLDAVNEYSWTLLPSESGFDVFCTLRFTSRADRHPAYTKASNSSMLQLMTRYNAR
jgi:hypothetical protein